MSRKNDRIVVCPLCRATPGRHCKTRTGGLASRAHKERRTLASKTAFSPPLLEDERLGAQVQCLLGVVPAFKAKQWFRENGIWYWPAGKLDMRGYR